MKHPPACRLTDHLISRRTMLGGLLGGAVGGLHPIVADELKRTRKQVLFIFLGGGASQLETWDPKPGTETGGPLQTIPTSVPGIHISELLPHTAQQMHRLALVRSVKTREARGSHPRGQYLMETGRPPTSSQGASGPDPALGSLAAWSLADSKELLPGYVHIRPPGSMRRIGPAVLGPKYGELTLIDGKPPGNVTRPDSVSEAADRLRNELRQQADGFFARNRRSAAIEAYGFSYEQAAMLMKRKDLFELGQVSDRDWQRYGTGYFGRHCLLARRLLETGIRCVRVSQNIYDAHYDNFHFHIHLLAQFDRPFAALLEDLDDRGLLDSTLVVVLGEFGRTPKINWRAGRDHWDNAWSIALGGCGIQSGAVIGKTNKTGTEVIDRPVGSSQLFHTYFRALGMDTDKTYYVDGRPIRIADPATSAVQELLA